MRNIYDIFESRQEDLLDAEFEQIQEGYEDILILEKQAVVTLESLVYNNPEKKKLSVLMEEAEANETMKTNNIVNKLREQMKRVINWIMNIFKFQQKMIDEGVKLVKSVDLNQCMVKIKRKGGNIPTIKYHPRKPPFEKIRSVTTKRIEKAISKVKHHHSNMVARSGYENEMEDDYEDDRLENNLVQFKLDKENLEDVRLDTINIMNIENTLLALPAANKYLTNVKNKVQDAYNKSINSLRNDHADDTKKREGKKATNSLKTVNKYMKIANERIRAYSKLMSIIFKEEYGAAKKIIALSRGESIENNQEENN